MQGEKHRIEAVYSRYGKDRRYRHRWGGGPGNALISQRRQDLLLSVLREHFSDFGSVRVLDVGCGGGLVLKQLTDFGFSPKNMFGLDIRLGRLKRAGRSMPELKFICGDASALCFPDDHFDLILMYTTLSSVLDASIRYRIGQELLRIVRQGAIIISYDVRFPNPMNPQTCAIRKKELRRIFPGCEIAFHSTTLIPQLARPLARVSTSLCSFLWNLPFLRSHYMAVIRRATDYPRTS